MKELFAVRNDVNGRGKILFEWQRRGNYLAVVGQSKRVGIYDRKGKLYHQFSLESSSGEVLYLDWDKDGEILSILSSNSSQICNFHLSTKKLEYLETNSKDSLTFMKWSQGSTHLAIATAKGNLFLYNSNTAKLIPIKGKHTKKIYTGCWSVTENILALASEDNHISFSNTQGDTLFQIPMKVLPQLLQFANRRIFYPSADAKQTALIAILNGQTIWMLQDISLYTSSTGLPIPIEINFGTKYNLIKQYEIISTSQMAVGFTNGYLCIVNISASTMTNDSKSSNVQSFKLFTNSLQGLGIIPNHSNILMTVGDDAIKSFDTNSLKESDTHILESEYGNMNGIRWSEDGQIITVGSDNGNIYNFVLSIPTVMDSRLYHIGYLSSLREVTCIENITNNNQEQVKVGIDVEPSIIVVGENYYMGVGLNNRMWYYQKDTLLYQREYLSTIKCAKMNQSFVALLLNDRALVHCIVKQQMDDYRDVYFPMTVEDQYQNNETVSHIALTHDLFIYSTTRGTICIVSLEDFQVLNEYRFDISITHIFSNFYGTRIVFVDETNALYLYNPVDDMLLPIQQVTLYQQIVNVLFDDHNSFVIIDGKYYITCVYGSMSSKGPFVQTYSQKTLKNNQIIPCYVKQGILYGYLDQSIQSQVLESHSALVNNQQMSNFTLAFDQYCFLLQFKEAFQISIANNNHGMEKLAQITLQCLDLETCIWCHQQLHNMPMVIALQQLQEEEELHVLSGYVSLFAKDFEDAESKFLQSSKKQLALQMRRDLMHWDRALHLAQSIDPSQIIIIAKEYAQVCEVRQEYSKAYDLYSRALNEITSSSMNVLIEQCEQGIARTCLRMGDVKRGIQMIVKSKNKIYCREGAQILEEIKHWNESAQLYYFAELFEKSVEMYILAKNWTKVDTLIGNITNPKLLLQYAKAKEMDGKYLESANAYEKSGDALNAIRLYLTKLNQISKAIACVKQSQSLQGAYLIAKYSLEQEKNYNKAMEFFLLANKKEEAIDIALQYHQVDELLALIYQLNHNHNLFYGNDGRIVLDERDAQLLAHYYVEKQQHGKAAYYYAQLQQYEKSVNLYLQSGKEEDVEHAIELVGTAKDELITKKVITFLMNNNTTNHTNNGKLIFKLYMELGNYAQAMTSALTFAKQEQDMGNYTNAHLILRDAIKQCKSKQVTPLMDIVKNLMLLHSYLMIKELLKMNEPNQSAKLLIRVSKNISKFPCHTIQILTSTVIQCYKCGLKEEAYEYASILARPEHLNKIEPQFKKMIINIVRNYNKNKQQEEESKTNLDKYTPCPMCHEKVECMELDCPSCKNFLPFCIVTGEHMIWEDWCECPHCAFPALHSKLVKLLSVNGQLCPMCNQSVCVEEWIQKKK